MRAHDILPLTSRLTGAMLVIGLGLSACGGQPTDSAAATAESTPAGSASAEPMPPSVSFSFASPEPVVTREMTGIEESYINPGAIIEHDGVLHMFANVFTGWPGRVQVPHLTSADGLSWTLDPPEPVLTSDEIPFGTPGADVSTGFVADDGTWVLIFSTVSSLDPWILGRATAPGPEGPWTIDPEPILEPGPEGSWDAAGLSWPSVVRTDDGFALYFTGLPTRRGNGAIGMATSGDGVTWTKAADPVMVAEQAWEQGGLDRPRVVDTGAGMVMVYSGRDLTDRGVALSEDGVAWIRDGEAPAITQDDFPVDGRCWDAALLLRDGTLHYYLEIGTATAARGTQVYLATGDLP